MKKILHVIPVLPALILANATSAYAADNEAREWYFSPMLSYIKSDNDRLADDDFGFHLGIAKQTDDDWDVELSLVLDNLSFEAGSGEYKQRGLVIDGLYFFDRQQAFQTYAVIGAGVLSTDIGSTDSTNSMINAGVGVMHKITDSGIRFRADVRYRMDLDDQSIASEDEFNDLLINVGFTIPFGDESKPRPANKVSNESINKDSDNDGVLDNVDRCPGTAVSADVDVNGCKLVKVEEAPLVVKDIDSDNDGIIDSKDKCLNSKAGINVDNNGCELQQSFVLKGVNFITGSGELTKESIQVLDDVADTLKNNPDLRVEIAGYTDDRGNYNLNQQLSQKRADSVKSHLVSTGVDGANLLVKGYGEDSPIADKSTSSGRSQNRRVEIHVLK